MWATQLSGTARAPVGADLKSKGRRGRGEHSVYETKDGRWVANISLGRGPDGKRRRQVIYAPTKADVLAKLRKASPTPLSYDSKRKSVRQFLEYWLDQTQPLVAARTYRQYKDLVNLHGLPHIGTVPLGYLSAAHLQGLQTDLLRREASPRTRELVHVVLRRAFGQGVRWGELVSNPSDAVDKPRTPRHQITTLTAKQVGTLLKSTRPRRLHTLYSLAVTTGMRRGELLGIQWADVDLARGYVAVRRSVGVDGGKIVIGATKSGKERRIALSAIAIEALRRHPKIRIGPWVFATVDGTPLNARNVLRTYWRDLELAKLPRLRFHDLRHTAATLLLQTGAHPKVVQEQLGHASIKLTMDTYSHVLPTLQKDAATQMDALIGPEIGYHKAIKRQNARESKKPAKS